MVVMLEDGKSNFWEPCWACRIIAGDPSGCIVTEAQDVLVLINPFALAAGYALVVPRQHIQNLYELPDALAGPILSTAARIARAAKRAFAAEGITLRKTTRRRATSTYFTFTCM